MLSEEDRLEAGQAVLQEKAPLSPSSPVPPSSCGPPTERPLSRSHCSCQHRQNCYSRSS